MTVFVDPNIFALIAASVRSWNEKPGAGNGIFHFVVDGRVFPRRARESALSADIGSLSPGNALVDLPENFKVSSLDADAAFRSLLNGMLPCIIIKSRSSSFPLEGHQMPLTRIGETKTNLATFLRETLQLVALEDYPAQIFLMESGDSRNDWQIAVDMLYRCVESGLVQLHPYGDGMELLSRKQYFEQMSRSDPGADGSHWDSIKIWVGTYVVGTIKCIELLAAHGLLNTEEASMLARGLREQAGISPELYPDRNFAAASNANSHADLLEKCVKASLEVASLQSNSVRIDEFDVALERILENCGVPLGDTAIFPVISER